MPPALIAVTGKVLTPSGAAATGGDIVVTLKPPGTIVDGGTDQLIGGSFTTPIASNGAVSFNIVPNATILPAGSLYEALIVLPDGTEFLKTWNIAAAPSSQDIGDL